VAGQTRGPSAAGHPTRPDSEHAEGPRPKRRNKSGAIGTQTETAVVRFLRANGFEGAERRRLKGKLDEGDITGTPGIVWEVKGGNAARTASDAVITGWLDDTETERQNAHADLGILVVQRSGIGPANAGRWWAVMPLWVVTYLIECADTISEDAFAPLAETYVIGASDPDTPWMQTPVRMLLADVVALLRSAGYGDPPGPGGEAA